MHRGQNGPENSVMVLPFRNLGGSPDDEYFVDAITDDLTTDLSRLPHSFVIGSGTAMTYRGKSGNERAIGRDLGVRYLLEGSVRRVGGKAQINAQFVYTATDSNIWAQHFLDKIENLTDFKEALTGRIGAAWHVEVAQARIHDTDCTFAADNKPLDERLHGMALTLGMLSAEKIVEARKHAEECVNKDPKSSECWTLLSRLLITEYLNHWNDAGPELVDRAEEAYKKALEIKLSNAAAYHAAGNVLRARGDHTGSLAAYMKVLELDPNFAPAHGQAANQLVFLGRGKKAIAHAEMAIKLSPHDPQIGVFYWVLGRAYFTEGNYREAAVWLRKSVEELKTVWYSRAWLISALSLTGNQAEAATYLTEFTQEFPKFTLAKIKSHYAEETRHKNDAIQSASEHLLRGLTQAGLK